MELIAIGKIFRRIGVALAGETDRDHAAFGIRASFGMESRLTGVGWEAIASRKCGNRIVWRCPDLSLTNPRQIGRVGGRDELIRSVRAIEWLGWIGPFESPDHRAIAPVSVSSRRHLRSRKTRNSRLSNGFRECRLKFSRREECRSESARQTGKTETGRAGELHSREIVPNGCENSVLRRVILFC